MEMLKNVYYKLEENHQAGLSELFEELEEILIMGDIGINAFCRSASKCESFDFRDVATDDGRLQLVHDPKRGVRPKGGSACTDRVEQDRMLKLLRAVSCAEHSLDASLI